MKKIEESLLFLLIVLVGCSKRNPGPLITRWEKNIAQSGAVERSLASTSQGRCLKNIFNVDTLKEEIFELEKKYAEGQRVEGRWKHLDLSELPVPQANFLNTFGNEIGDLRDQSTIDYSSCRDLPCLFNKIYGKEDHVAGYVHYLWYLKFGNMLSADNKVPDQKSSTPGEYNGRVIDLKKYLFHDKELYALWRLTLMLRPPHTTLSYLKEIQRVPRGERIEKNEYAQACGLAHSGGWIILTDGCLKVDENSDEGYLYQAVLHELSHHLDFELGRGTRAFYRSHKKDYLKMSGMLLEEYVNEKGKIIRKWVHAPGIKMISDYAGTSPQENFAESISMFRIHGEETKNKINDEHYQFLSTEYYQNRRFEKEDLMKQWIQEYSEEVDKDVFKAVADCSQGTSSPQTDYFKASDFSSAPTQGMMNCLGSKASDISQYLKVRTTLYEAEGCKVHDDLSTNVKWNQFMKEHLISSFTHSLEMLSENKDHPARLDVFQKIISDKTIAGNAYVNCFKEDREKECFHDEIKREISEKASNRNLPSEKTKEWLNTYMAQYPYDLTRDEKRKNYQVFVSTHLEKIRIEALKTWEGCFNLSHNDLDVPSGRHFLISDGYMISSFYNCLNTQIPTALKVISRGFSVDGSSLRNAKEEMILIPIVQVELIRILKEKYFLQREIESKKASEILVQNERNIREKLLSNLNWVTDDDDSKRLLFDCKKQGYKSIDFVPMFNLPSTLFSDVLERKICPGIFKSNEFIRKNESFSE